MDDLDYRLVEAETAGAAVPRLLLQRLPDGMAVLDEQGSRKLTFLRALLPLVLAANERVAQDRAYLLDLSAGLEPGTEPDAGDRRRLKSLAQAYRVGAPADIPAIALIERLLPRVDIVPPSLALAQAAVESAWGTSRFAREGNALFGQSSWSEDGMAPLGHEVAPYRIAAFATLADCVAAYVANLNSHPAYDGFRRLRAAQRQAGQTPDGRALAATLHAYAETGERYIRTLRAVIDDNDLGRFDRAILDDGRTVFVVAAR
jgi:Bax protein